MDKLTIEAVRRGYELGEFSPRSLMQKIRQQALELGDEHIWITLLSEEEQEPYFRALEYIDFEKHPLWGIPFAIKDNIDLAGIPTTAACPAFAYVPEHSAWVVQRLLEAGAIPVGKTNLDQFATGLNGTRSPYGICRNAYNSKYISGGSSSGSAVAVARGLVSFSLGTDTAGSGRVPAAFNQLVGVKPTRGLLSIRGLVPACKTLDCISIFALNVNDAHQVLTVAEERDDKDEFSRPNPFSNSARYYGTLEKKLRIGILPTQQLKFFGDQQYEQAYKNTLKCLDKLAIEWKEIDYSGFDEAARLLYEGPWVAERYLACMPLIEEQPEALNPIVRTIVEAGKQAKATDLFKAQYRLKALKKYCTEQLEGLDALLLPTAGKLYTIQELSEEPIMYNSQLGYYTNFMNLLDLSAVALPTLITENGLPFGITLASLAFRDRYLLSLSKRLELFFSTSQTTAGGNTISSDNEWIEVVVCGAHLTGFALNWQLVERGGQLVEQTRTAPHYQMYLLEGKVLRPGLIWDDSKGQAIEVEVWKVPSSDFGSFVNEISRPLGIGKIQLDSGRWVSGFICEPYAVEKAQEITGFGGWRAFMNAK
ncbi:MAG: allophanate hydrolase [Neisseriaceae bacterium]